MASNKGKVLAIDYGKKSIGLASGELEFGIAFPRELLVNRGLERLIGDLHTICESENIRIIVIGLPLSMEGSHRENPLVAEIKTLAGALQKALPETEVTLLDERLSTFEASKYRDSLPKGERLDSHAAMVILERYFSSKI